METGHDEQGGTPDSPRSTCRLSAGLAVFVLAMTMWNFPILRIRNDYRYHTWQLAVATGTVQDWDLFAPDPATEAIFVHAVITMRNGRFLRYEQPNIDRGLGAVRGYRWAAFMENVYFDASATQQFAEWLLEENGGPDQVRRVEVFATVLGTPAGRAGDYSGRSETTTSLYRLDS